ncbi:L-ribulose-5-phosphate 4-epimerase AraD [Candidatus Sumerlaeota bacterium]|nr:L-ribulose-5-phosphate 4-epimerase AraD [Candidatus Sumerlaeota bacterium]
MGFEKLKQEVLQANIGLVKAGLVVLTWGNASGADRRAGVMAIKPSGVEYERLQLEDIVILSLDTGEVVEGSLRPSSDAPTHLFLYNSFNSIGGIIHTHSIYATTWAQACKEIPCLGTTHADCFFGPVPLTRQLLPQEIENDYEYNTGKVIVERFSEAGLNPEQVPGVLLPRHGPFVWGPTPMAALENAIALEEVARMGLYTILLNPEIGELHKALLNKHFLRKHGTEAYYGQRS